MAQGLQIPDSVLGGMPNMPSLGQQFGEAKKENADAMAEVATAKKASSDARMAGKDKIEKIQSGAPPVPDLKPLPDKFEHKGMDDKAMTDAMQTMFVFAALGGAMTRTPMTGAMKAFGGALKGLAQGDQVAFQREGAEFDKNLKLAMTKNNEALSKYKLAFDKHKGDLSAALQEIQLEAAAHNDTVTGAMARANNAKGVMQQVQSMARTEGQMANVQKRFEFMVKDSERKHQENMARMEQNERRMQQQQEQFAAKQTLDREKAQMKANSTANMGKPSATERQHYVDSNQLLKSVDRVEQMLADPDTRQKIDESAVGNYLSDAVESKAIQQFLVRPNLDPKVKAYLTEVSNLRNQYYLDMSGKAVTGGEALRNFGAVVQPSDKADDVLNKMNIAKTRTQEKMRDMETYFPSLAVIKGNNPKSAGAPHEPFADADKEKRYQEWKAKQGGG